MRVAETSKLRAGSVYKKTYVYFTICECENCRKRFNVKRKDYDFCVRAGRTIGKFCSMKCRRAFHKKKICAVDNCKAKPVGKYCSRHYRRFKKYGNPLGDSGLYECIVCSKSIRVKNNNKWEEFKNVCCKCKKKYLRDLVIEKLGSKCSCCSETIKDFLQIDHIEEGGNSERRLLKSSDEFHLRVLKYHNNYRLLCANCNWGSYRGNGICPHNSLTHTSIYDRV
jgi:hypothetical protein